MSAHAVAIAATIADLGALAACGTLLVIIMWLLWGAIAETGYGMSRWGYTAVGSIALGLGWVSGRLGMLVAASFGWL
jgi:hypothetical protein